MSSAPVAARTSFAFFDPLAAVTMDGKQDTSRPDSSFVALGLILRNPHADQGACESSHCPSGANARQCSDDRSRRDKRAETGYCKCSGAHKPSQRTADCCARSGASRCSLGGFRRFFRGQVLAFPDSLGAKPRRRCCGTRYLSERSARIRFPIGSDKSQKPPCFFQPCDFSLNGFWLWAATCNQLDLAAPVLMRAWSDSVFLAAATASPMPSADSWPFASAPVAPRFASIAGPQLLVRLIARLPRAVRPGFVVVVGAGRIRIDLSEYCHLRSFQLSG